MKKKLLISFSGGRTSAFMTKWLLDNKQDEYEMKVVFANTGKEREETLEFIRDCDKHFGFNTVWIETVMQEYGVGASFKIVNFETASRKGEPFRDVIKKHGIPNMASKHCTREMKSTPIKAYIRSTGWKPKEYETAIGFRIDKPKRFNTPKKKKSAIKKKHIYPLVYWLPMKKQEIHDWWKKQEFDLKLKDHEGNCDLCWKKTENKLIAIIGVCPSRADWWKQMENEFENFTPDSKKHNKKIKPPHRFFIGNVSISELEDKAKKFFEQAKDETAIEIHEQALVNNYNPKQIRLCNESCEPF